MIVCYLVALVAAAESAKLDFVLTVGDDFPAREVNVRYLVSRRILRWDCPSTQCTYGRGAIVPLSFGFGVRIEIAGKAGTCQHILGEDARVTEMLTSGTKHTVQELCGGVFVFGAPRNDGGELNFTLLNDDTNPVQVHYLVSTRIRRWHCARRMRDGECTIGSSLGATLDRGHGIRVTRRKEAVIEGDISVHSSTCTVLLAEVGTPAAAMIRSGDDVTVSRLCRGRWVTRGGAPKKKAGDQQMRFTLINDATNPVQVHYLVPSLRIRRWDCALRHPARNRYGICTLGVSLKVTLEGRGVRVIRPSGPGIYETCTVVLGQGNTPDRVLERMRSGASMALSFLCDGRWKAGGRAPPGVSWEEKRRRRQHRNERREKKPRRQKKRPAASAGILVVNEAPYPLTCSVQREGMRGGEQWEPCGRRSAAIELGGTVNVDHLPAAIRFVRKDPTSTSGEIRCVLTRIAGNDDDDASFEGECFRTTRNS